MFFFLCRGSDHDAISVTVSLGTPPAPPAPEEPRPATDQPEQSNQTNQTVQGNESNATNVTQQPNETVESEPAATSFSEISESFLGPCCAVLRCAVHVRRASRSVVAEPRREEESAALQARLSEGGPFRVIKRDAREGCFRRRRGGTGFEGLWKTRRQKR